MVSVLTSTNPDRRRSPSGASATVSRYSPLNLLQIIVTIPSPAAPPEPAMATAARGATTLVIASATTAATPASAVRLSSSEATSRPVGTEVSTCSADWIGCSAPPRASASSSVRSASASRALR